MASCEYLSFLQILYILIQISLSHTHSNTHLYQMDESPEGKVYAQRYHVYDYPHIAFIDPRTRRLMWKKEGWTQEKPMTAELFAETAMDFCSRHSFDKPPVAPRPSGANNRPAKRHMSEMSFDDQMQEAMRASLEESSSVKEAAAVATAVADGSGGDGDDEDIEFLGTSNEEDAKPKAEEKEPSMMDELIAMALDDEPASGARIQLRMPDGKRKVRRFDVSKTVKTIYAFIAVRLSCAFVHKLSQFVQPSLTIFFFDSNRTTKRKVEKNLYVWLDTHLRISWLILTIR